MAGHNCTACPKASRVKNTDMLRSTWVTELATLETSDAEQTDCTGASMPLIKSVHVSEDGLFCGR